MITKIIETDFKAKKVIRVTTFHRRRFDSQIALVWSIYLNTFLLMLVMLYLTLQGQLRRDDAVLLGQVPDAGSKVFQEPRVRGIAE